MSSWCHSRQSQSKIVTRPLSTMGQYACTLESMVSYHYPPRTEDKTRHLYQTQRLRVYIQSYLCTVRGSDDMYCASVYLCMTLYLLSPGCTASPHVYKYANMYHIYHIYMGVALLVKLLLNVKVSKSKPSKKFSKKNTVNVLFLFIYYNQPGTVNYYR